MEQSFWGKLKRVKICDLIHIFKFLLMFPISIFYKMCRKDLWVLCDTKNEARDNAYWLFVYLREEHPNQDVVFAIDKKSPDYLRVQSVGKVVQFGSFYHWLLYLSASKNVSSQKMGKPNAAICYIMEVWGILKNKRVFLQHGIITADLSFLYYKNTKMSLFVTSTNDEWEYVKGHYGYPEGVVQKLGLCRFDQLHNFKINKKRILIMPTWRMYIRNQIPESNQEMEMEEFKKTEYFIYWNALISNEKFILFIQENEMEVIFYPHREMKRFLKCFNIETKNISIASWPEYDMQQMLKEAALLITDFSSVAMDFAYMKKPLIYYQFDNEKFRQSHHGNGYFDFKKDGFGKVCVEAEEVVSQIIKYHYHNFENEAKYIRRHTEYFDLWDKNNCRRNYEAIIKL